MRQHGYTMVETMMSTGIIAIVSLLGFVVLQSTTEATNVTNAKAMAQSSLRDIMGILQDEISRAYTERTIDDGVAPDDVAAIEVDPSGTSITYQIPIPVNTPEMVEASAPITLVWENEDILSGEPPRGNGKLDPGEDTNEDGVLTQRLIRQLGAEEIVLAATNHLTGVQFTLVENLSDTSTDMTSLRIQLQSVVRYGPDQEKLAVAELESVIQLHN